MSVYEENLFQSRSTKLCKIVDIFCVSIASCKHKGELRDFEEVLQTPDAVCGFHNYQEFFLSVSVRLWKQCLGEAMETPKIVL